MSDVFISYSHEDREVARGLSDFLADCGYDVWWDHELVGGVKYRVKIKEELGKARAAIVIWTPSSIESDFVIEEAEEAKQGGKLIATRIDSLEYRAIPLGFRGVHTDAVTAPERILRALEELGVSPSRPPKAPKPGPVIIGKGLDPDAIARAEQFAHWEFIKDSSDPAPFARFIEMFPASSFTPLAKTQLDRFGNEAWQKLTDCEDIATLEEFARMFPHHLRAAEATKRVDLIRTREAEAASWARVQNSAELAAVEAHIARFPEGANAPAALALLQRLRRELEAGERWRAIAESPDLAAMAQFALTYADTSFAAAAQSRVDELRRAREEKDWIAVHNARHPAPVLRFLKTHPDGARAREALGLLGELPRITEEEAWAEIKDAGHPILFQAYLVALPRGANAKAASARLKSLSNGKTAAAASGAAMPAQTLASIAMPTPVPPRDTTRQERNRAGFCVLVGLMALVALFATAAAITAMNRQYAAGEVSGWLLLAAALLCGAGLVLYFGGPRIFRGVSASAHQSIMFHAVGSMGLLLWIALTQATAEPYHQQWGSIDNVWTYRGGLNALAVFVVLVAAATVLASERMNRFRWLRYAWYALLPLIGFIYLTNGASDLSGLAARDYWVTTCLNVYGGAALILLSGIVVLNRIHAGARSSAASASLQ